MVLSNKKLKQKLRGNLAESFVQSEIQNNNSTIQPSLKSLLDSAIHKPRISKREKRRENSNGVSPAPIHTTGGAEADEQIVPEEEKVKKIKRKRDADEQIGPEEEKVKKIKKRWKDEDDKGESKRLMQQSNEKKTKKKQKKNNKQKKGISNGGGGEVKNIIKSEIEGSDEQIVKTEVQVRDEPIVAEETVKNNHSEEKVELSTKVYVGGIPYYSTEDDIRSFFESCGSITNIDCMLFPDSGKFRGIAIISFKTEAAAKRALELDGADMGGLFLKVQLYKATREHKLSDFSPAIIDGYNRIYIGNLSWDITEDEIRSFFSDFSISSVRLGQDKETKEFKGFAHVDFTDKLSVTMALKLDQTILRGRPARIRCAVPKKAATPAPTLETPAGIKVEPEDVEMSQKNDYAEMNENVDSGGAASGKIRRRTCYECGEKGHVSSDCPKKPAAVVIDSGRRFDEMSEYPVEVSEKVDSVASRKIRRRTCYECGEKGHVSSDCPKKPAAVVIDSGKRFEEMSVNPVDVSEKFDSVASGKIRRRTCYECGEKGHLSSDCPKKSGEVIDPGTMDHGEKFVEKPVETTEKFDNGSGGGDAGAVSVPSGKIRRRTCYECGEKGHLSSACPKKSSV